MSRRIVLVGGNSGIGAALRDRLQSAGDDVETFSRSQASALDVTDESPAFPEIEGPIHGLAYLPGSINLKPFANLEIADFRQDLEINFLGAVRTVQQYLPNLKQADQAAIVLFSTVAVSTGMEFHASIAAAKGAVEGFARSLAAELAPQIRVNVVAPSLTETPMAQRLLRSEKQRETAARRHPLARIGAPQDVAAAAEFLLSDRAAWTTGQVLQVDGGMSSVRML